MARVYRAQPREHQRVHRRRRAGGRWAQVLASTRRAPTVYRFGQRASETVASLRATSGDVLVALSSLADPVLERAAWAEALSDGAGAVLELLESSCRDGEPVQGAVLEIL